MFEAGVDHKKMKRADMRAKAGSDRRDEELPPWIQPVRCRVVFHADEDECSRDDAGEGADGPRLGHFPDRDGGKLVRCYLPYPAAATAAWRASTVSLEAAPFTMTPS